jgi:glucans biosynthesis protein C
MLASYHLLVRYTYIGIVLNGRRFRRDRTRAVVTGFAAP